MCSTCGNIGHDDLDDDLPDFLDAATTPAGPGEQAWADLPPADQEPVKAVMLRLAGPGQPGSLARQPLLLLIDGEGGARRPPGTGE